MVLFVAFSFLVITNSSGFGLKLTNIMQVKPNCACAERVRFQCAAVLLVGGAEAADEGVQAAPRLPERAGARRRRVRNAKEGTRGVVHLGFPELVKVVEEFQHVCAAAYFRRERWPVVPKILAEGVPVSALLVLVPARSCSSSVSTITIVG